MKARKVEGSEERAILTAMLVDRTVLGAIASRFADGLFASRWSNLVASWCVDYYRRYRKPPGKNIVTLFDLWAQEAHRDNETVQLIEKFLGSLSNGYARLKESINPDYVLDISSQFFTRIRLQNLRDELEAALDNGDILDAEKHIQSFSRVEVNGQDCINVMEDMEAFQQAFEAKQEPLIEYSGGLGRFYDDALERDGFIAFMGPEKRGKTWCLLDIAWTAMMQRKKVAFFEVGDMSKNQIMRRFAVRIAKHPIKPQTVFWPKTIALEHAEDNKKRVVAVIEHEERKFKQGLSWQKAWKCAEQIRTKRTRTNQPLLKLSCHPNSSISVLGIQNILTNWERDGWAPDVVVIDYADILAPISGKEDTRDQINATWKQLRALSQSLHCLVVTATQAKATSYSLELLTKAEFSEDKRKLAHVTGMVGLNASSAEKEQGVLRLNWIVRREEDYSDRWCCHVATCLALANPAVRSVYRVRGESME